MDVYGWVKALHVISVISWMAGLLYLPRLYVYHASVSPGSEASETFKVMERKLLRFIMNPAMIVSFASGIWLIWILSPAIWQSGWLHGKIVLVLGMAAMHGVMARWRKAFAQDANRHTGRFFRIMNEIPTVLMIVIVVLVILQPF